MATKNIVPRANNEGQIGTAAKNWNKVITNELNIGTIVVAAIGADGWAALGACTYEGADAPTYTISFASDMTAVLGVGMRIKVTDSTVKYFIIVAVGTYTAGKTIITVYGGTDYTLSGGAITFPYYSVHKAPFGFPLSPLKWEQRFVQTSDVTTNTPTQNIWYNVASLAIPIGAWAVSYEGIIGVVSAASKTGVRVSGTLSTANNSESSTEMSAYQGMSGAAGTLVCIATIGKRKLLTLTSKATYYFNYRTISPTADIASLVTAYANQPLVIVALCAYL